MNSEEHDRWISSQKVMSVALIFGRFNEDNFYEEKSIIICVNLCATNLPSPIECSLSPRTEIYVVPNELVLLHILMDVIQDYQPNFITGHNIIGFDFKVLEKRFQFYQFPWPVNFQESNLNLLSKNWREVVKNKHGYLILDTLLFAKRFLTMKFGNDLASLTRNLIHEFCLKLKKEELGNLLPIDCWCKSTLVSLLVDYNYQHANLTLKLCMLFQKEKFILPTYRMVKSTLPRILKHRDVFENIVQLAPQFHELRRHTLQCLQLFLSARFERGEALPEITEQMITSVMTRINYLCAQFYGQPYKRPSSAIDADLERFVMGEAQFDSNSIHKGYRIQLEANEGHNFPMFPPQGFSRPPEYIAPVLLCNINNNLKLHFEKHINRFINVYFGKKQSEEEISNLIKELPREERPDRQQTLTLYRFALRQIKDIFTAESVDNFNLLLSNQFCLEKFEEDWKDKAGGKGMRPHEQDFLYDAFIYPYVVEKFEILQRSPPFELRVLRPFTKILELEKKPQLFMPAAITMNRYVKEKEEAAFHWFPAVTTVIPGYFPIDTRTLWSIVRQNKKTKDLKLMNNQAEVTKFKPKDQHDFWKMFVNFDLKEFKKKDYVFNNIILSDGQNCSIELVRRDFAGEKRGKDDLQGKIKEVYCKDLRAEKFTTKKVVVCDPGKGIYFILVEEMKNKFKKTSVIGCD
ncbi:hypothetical protein GEMRC1_001769 [Eukaryota sp. GEM-RC1]